MNARSLLIPVLLLLNAPLYAQTTSTSASAPATAPRAFGKSVQGLRVSIATAGPVSSHHLTVDILVESQASDPVSLEGSFAWLTIAQGRDKAYFSTKMAVMSVPAGSPASVTTTAPFSAKLDVAPAKAYAFRADLVVKDGYPDIGEAPALGTLGKQLPQGRSRARVNIYVPALKALVASNAIEIVLDSPDMSQILPGFSRDAVAAKDAHDRCLKIGAAAVPDLIALLEERKAPWFGQMWIAATLVDLADARAVPVLIATVKKGGAPAHVIAYHGAKFKDADLSAAIEGAAKDPLVAAWAARGSIEFAGTPRPELVDTAIAALEKTTDRHTLVECLEKITGQKLGDDPAKWKAWWSAHRAEFAKTKP